MVKGVLFVEVVTSALSKLFNGFEHREPCMQIETAGFDDVLNVIHRAAFTNGPTGPGPRGPLIFVNLGGLEQDLKKTYKVVLNAILCLNLRLQTTQ